MDTFTFKARDLKGKLITGVIEAKDVQSVAATLHKQAVFIVEIKKGRKTEGISIPFFHRSAKGELVSFTRQVASMIATGLTISESLWLLATQTRNTQFAAILQGIIRDIEAGNSLSESFGKYPTVFPEVYIALIKAAEAAGLLDKILLRLADNLEKQRDFRRKVQSALVYPIVVVVGIVAVMIIMMVFVVPQLKILYHSLAIELPLPTRIVIGISEFISNFWFVVIGAVILFVFAIRRWRKTEIGVRRTDDLLLRIPIFGPLNQKLILTEITRTLGLLTGAGTPIIETLTITSRTAGNVWYRESLLTIAQKAEKGVPLSQAISAEPHFPLIVSQMVRVGETTGKLDESFLRVSSYFEGEATQMVATLTILLEPLIMIVLGLGVGLLIISIITPIYNLTSAIQ